MRAADESRHVRRAVCKGKEPASRVGAPCRVDEYGAEVASVLYAVVDEVAAVAAHHIDIVDAQTFGIVAQSLCAFDIHFHRSDF